MTGQAKRNHNAPIPIGGHKPPLCWICGKKTGGKERWTQEFPEHRVYHHYCRISVNTVIIPSEPNNSPWKKGRFKYEVEEEVT